MVKSGWPYPFGLGFWGANGHDGIWHIALIENLAKGSLEMPIFTGYKIQNYHIGFDLILAAIHKVTFIPTVNLYFQVVPPILALLVGILTYRLVRVWTKSEQTAFWSTFFVYFGGNFGWVLGKGESAFWSTQAISTLVNPPFALSLTIILLGLIFLLKCLKSSSALYPLLAIVLFGVLLEIKAYGGVLVLGGLLLAGIWQVVKSRKFIFLKIFLGSLIFSTILYLLLNRNSAGLFSWQPFWFLEAMVAASDRLNIPKLAEAMTSYRYQHVIRKFIPTYCLVFLVFVIGNLGTRVVSFFRNPKKIDEFDIFYYSIIAAGILIPTFFIQQGTPWNTIQFIYYSLFFSGILAGVVLGRLFEKTNKLKIKIPICFLVVAATIPTTVISLRDIYVPGRPPAMLPNDEMEALNFLKKQPNGIVFTYPFEKEMADKWMTAPKPLYLYTSTAYVSAFSSKPIFFGDVGNLDITGYEWPARLAEIEAWYKEPNQTLAREFLKKNKIKYVYWLKGQRAYLGEAQLGLNLVFENEEVKIYVVQS